MRGIDPNISISKVKVKTAIADLEKNQKIKIRGILINTFFSTHVKEPGRPNLIRKINMTMILKRYTNGTHIEETNPTDL